MHKSFAYALMLAATLGIAACDKPAEDKAEEARAAQESMNDAAEESNEAARQADEAAQGYSEPAPAAPVTPAPPPVNQQQQP